MGVAQRGVVAPLNFHTWYKYTVVDRSLKVLFSAFFAIFGLFSVAPPPSEEAK